MIILTGDSANELYVAACRTLHRHGVPVSPRGMATTEVMGVHLRLTDRAAAWLTSRLPG